MLIPYAEWPVAKARPIHTGSIARLQIRFFVDSSSFGLAELLGAWMQYELPSSELFEIGLQI
jgi:hypothetical protein